jgi:hypothetical protein
MPAIAMIESATVETVTIKIVRAAASSRRVADVVAGDAFRWPQAVNQNTGAMFHDRVGVSC